MRLKATRTGTYGTRRLQAGEEFTATRQYGNLWMLIGRAVPVEDEPVRAEPTIPVADKTEDDDLTELRSEYQRVIGRRAYHGWDADTLREKIEEADQET